MAAAIRDKGDEMKQAGLGLRSRLGLLAGCVVTIVALAAPGGAVAAFEIEKFGGEYLDASGQLLTQAGAHPEVVTGLLTPEAVIGGPEESLRNAVTDLPPGLILNPSAVSTCTQAGVAGGGFDPFQARCAGSSQVGMLELRLSYGPEGGFNAAMPLYNISPGVGEPGRFAANLFGVIVNFTAEVRSDKDYGITALSPDAAQSLPVLGATVRLWGVPADSSHDPQRFCAVGAVVTEGCSAEAPRQALTSFPTSCSGQPLRTDIAVNTWENPTDYKTASFDHDPKGNPLLVEGCNQLDFRPTIEARPTTNLADSPSGLDVKIHIPQNTDPDGLSEAHLRDATMTFPAGMTVNPSSATGLGSCSPAQVGLQTAVGQTPPVFSKDPASCPESSKLGTVQIDTPVLDHPLAGEVYLASQNENPFNSLLALYIAIDDEQSGIVMKLAGQPVPDPQTGRLTVSFANNPQLPFEDLRVNLFTGPRAALKTPMTCGQFTTTSTLTPWSAPEGQAATPSDSFGIVSGANGSSCLKSEEEAPNRPSFSAGTVDPAAGAYTPFLLKLARADGTQPIKAIDTTLPKGLLGKLAGVSYCPDSALAGAAGKSGKSEQAAASCPASSQVGSVAVGAGAGSNPVYVNGKAYLAGPYKGAPLSLAVITPAVAGPFDLGTVVIRNALNVDPETTRIRAVSDPIPTILQGIPLDIRSVALKLDRSSFTLNPTSCAPTSIDGSVLSVFDQSSPLSNRFQVGGCKALGFKPKLAIDLKGGTKRSKYPALKATLTARPGDANIGKAVVSLPRSEFLAQNHIKTICTRVQFAADACPPGSVYGKATAWSPLLEKPLSGPVYLRSSSNELPDLVADLKGQIRVALVGRIDSVRGGIRTSFESVPDAPVSKFVLEMAGGKKGLLENSRNLCKSVNKADVQMDGQNGKAHDSKPVVTNDCKAKKKKSKAKKGKKGQGKRGAGR